MIEVRIRVFLKDAEGNDVVPSATLVASEAMPSLDVAVRTAVLVRELDDWPFGAVRQMTSAEMKAYCDKEEADDGYSDLGLSDADLEVRS